MRLRLNSPTALFMPFEGLPTNLGGNSTEIKAPVLNLNKEFVDYLFARLAEVGDEPLLLQVRLSADASKTSLPEFSTEALQSAIQRYFAYLEDVRRQDLQKLAWDAALLGLLGAAALGLSVVLESQNSPLASGIGLLLFNQGVTVFGWLTLWEALANVLWHWRPLYEQLCMCQRLQYAQLEVTAS